MNTPQRGDAGPRARTRRVARVLMTFIAAIAMSNVGAGPVEIYREGVQYCPRDRSSAAVPLSEEQAIERARTLLPSDFCGPTPFVSGCDPIPEFALGAWRIFFHQYKLRDGVKDYGGLTHTYLILDRVGNCLANIPGTELGAGR